LRNWKRPWLGVALRLLLVFLVGIVIAVVCDYYSRSAEDIWSNLSKAGIAVAFTTVAGALAAWALKLVDERRGRDEERRKVFEQVLEAYNECKSVRRRLAALGLLGNQAGALRPDEKLQPEAVKELRALMVKLNDAQLRFEAIKRVLDQSDLFRRKVLIIRELRMVEDYVNKSALDKWEAEGRCFWGEVDAQSVTRLGLQAFNSEFKRHVSAPLDRITDALEKELFGRRR
jgi:hypothetical protein